MFEYADAAVEAAMAAGARYADARVMDRRHESMNARNGEIEALTQEGSVGIGVPALIGSGGGFFATADLTTDAARQAGAQAVAIARASASVPGGDLELTPVDVRTDHWENPVDVDPLAVPLTEKGDLLVGATRTMQEHGADVALAAYDIWDTTKWLTSSEGHRIDQRIRECGAHMEANVNGEAETQRRSYPGIRGQYGTRGWELVRELDLLANAPRVAEEARRLLTADECPQLDATDLILGSEQMALQIHESIGHATELDRILGWEAAFAGTSWLDPRQLGSLRFGSDIRNVTAD